MHVRVLVLLLSTLLAQGIAIPNAGGHDHRDGRGPEGHAAKHQMNGHAPGHNGSKTHHPAMPHRAHHPGAHSGPPERHLPPQPHPPHFEQGHGGEARHDHHQMDKDSRRHHKREPEPHYGGEHLDKGKKKGMSMPGHREGPHRGGKQGGQHRFEPHPHMDHPQSPPHPARHGLHGPPKGSEGPQRHGLSHHSGPGSQHGPRHHDMHSGMNRHNDKHSEMSERHHRHPKREVEDEDDLEELHELQKREPHHSGDSERHHGRRGPRGHQGGGRGHGHGQGDGDDDEGRNHRDHGVQRHGGRGGHGGGHDGQHAGGAKHGHGKKHGGKKHGKKGGKKGKGGKSDKHPKAANGAKDPTHKDEKNTPKVASADKKDPAKANASTPPSPSASASASAPSASASAPADSPKPDAIKAHTLPALVPEPDDADLDAAIQAASQADAAIPAQPGAPNADAKKHARRWVVEDLD